jgi:hypothetical protein
MENNNNINTAVNNSNSNSSANTTTLNNNNSASNDSTCDQEKITIQAEKHDGFGFTLSRIYVNKPNSSEQDSLIKVSIGLFCYHYLTFIQFYIYLTRNLIMLWLFKKTTLLEPDKKQMIW